MLPHSTHPQVSFVSMAFGAGNQYSGLDLAKAHERLILEQGLGLPHFDAVAGHLVAAMTQLGVPEALIGEAAAVVMTTRDVFDPAKNGALRVQAQAEAEKEAAAAADKDAAAAAADKEQPSATVTAAAAAESLFARIGGAAAVCATVDVFYRRVLDDPLLAPFFQGVDMAKQRAKQVGGEWGGVGRDAELCFSACLICFLPGSRKFIVRNF